MRSAFGPLTVLVVGLLLLLAAAKTATAGGGFVVLVNRTNPVSSLSRAELRRSVVGGAKEWDNGAVVQLGIIPNDAPETRYLASLLDMSVANLFTRIQEQVFKGEMKRPISLKSSADCAAFARTNEGAVCVASDREPVPSEAKLLTIR